MVKRINPIQYFGPPPNDPSRFPGLVAQNPHQQDEQEAEAPPDGVDGVSEDTDDSTVTELSSKRVPKP